MILIASTKKHPVRLNTSQSSGLQVAQYDDPAVQQVVGRTVLDQPADDSARMLLPHIHSFNIELVCIWMLGYVPDQAHPDIQALKLLQFGMGSPICLLLR